MAKFKTSINLADAVRQFETLSKRAICPWRSDGDFFVVVETFDFGRDVNGNTINKYRASLHRGDMVSVENKYSDAFSIEILTSPRRREQSHGEGQNTALYWLGKMGYDLLYISMTDTTPKGSKHRSYRHGIRVDNKWLKHTK